MCGIFGWSVKSDRKVRNLDIIATCLSISMDARGGDSWGYSVDGKTQRGLKYLSDYIRPERVARAKTFMAHTRFATVGAINTKNSHPFEMDGIVGAHNGVVQNANQLNNRYKTNYAVDSQQIFAGINRSGFSLDYIKAYGAIEFYMADNYRRIYLSKFNGGQLAVAGILDKKNEPIAVIWASTKESLIRAIKAAEIRYYVTYKIDEDLVYYAQNGECFESGASLDIAAPYYPKYVKGAYKSPYSSPTTTAYDSYSSKGNSYELYDEDYQGIYEDKINVVDGVYLDSAYEYFDRKKQELQDELVVEYYEPIEELK